MSAPATNRAFGAAIRDRWPLRAGLRYLNHGTIGVTPRAILAEQTRIRDAIEQAPAEFMRHRQRPAMREAAGAVAAFIGAEAADLAFVANATTGINAVLASLDLGPGDQIVVTNQTYGAIVNAAGHYAARAGARVIAAELPFPMAAPEQAVAALRAVLTPATRLAVLDHITSDTALILPLAEMIAAARAAGAAVLVDGAHAPATLPLDMAAIDADWYVGNLHKWAFAPRGCGFLWANPARRPGGARNELHPTVISWGYRKGLAEEFDWTGTTDPSAFLAAPAALDFARELGLQAMRRYNHELVIAGADLLAERLGRASPVPAAMSGAMRLAPLPARFGADARAGTALRDRLLFEHQIEVPVVAHDGGLWLRLAAQVYNDIEDFEALARALRACAAA